MEDYSFEKKSLKLIKDKADLRKLAKTCVCLANAKGGIIVIGIEDGDDQPPVNQKIDDGLISKIRKRINDQTIKV
jgi:ATP-dependent DNA helicase RecG